MRNEPELCILATIVILLLLFQLPNLIALNIGQGLWRYVAEAKLLATTGKPTSPTFGEILPLNPTAPNPLVYFLAIMYKIGVEPTHTWRALVILTKLAIPLLIYFWLRKYDKTFALLSTLIFLAIFSWKVGLSPHRLINPFTPLACLFVYECLVEKKRKVLIAGVLSGIVLSLYLTTYLILLMWAFSLLLFNFNKQTLLTSIKLFLISLATWSILNLPVIFHGLPVHGRFKEDPYEKLYFHSFWHKEYPILDSTFFSAPSLKLPILLFSVLSIPFALMDKKYRCFVLFASFLLLFIWLWSTDASLTIDPKQNEKTKIYEIFGLYTPPSMVSVFTRLNTYFGFSLSILSAIFLVKVLNFIKRKSRLTFIFGLLLLVIAFSYPAFAAVGKWHKTGDVNEELIEGLKQLGKLPGRRVVTNLYTQGIIYYYSDKLSLTEGPIGSTEYLPWEDVVRKFALSYQILTNRERSELCKNLSADYIVFIKRFVPLQTISTFTLPNQEPIFRNGVIEIYRCE